MLAAKCDLQSRLWNQAIVMLSVALLLCWASAVQAIIINTTSPSNAINSTAPADDRGWQYVAEWRSSTAVAIGPHAFLTARHVGGSSTTVVQNDGHTYTVDQIIDMPGHDLRIVTVVETVVNYATLWSGGSEVGSLASLVGRGRVRDSTAIDEDPGPLANGWVSSYGNAQVMSWGMNTVDNGGVSVGSAYGTEWTLQYDFDREGGAGAVADEGIISRGDSGGGLFIYNSAASQWQLAGMNAYLVPPPPDLYRMLTGGTYENILPSTDDRLAIYNTTGLYVQSGPGYSPAPASDISQGYALQLSNSTYATWLADYTPEPTTVSLLVMGAAGLLLRRRRR